MPVVDAGNAFNSAIQDELSAWAALSVYEKVPFAGQRVLSTRWVLKVKEPESPTAPPCRKARLVVRVFEDPSKDTVDSTSPTAARATIRVLLSAFASRGI